MPRQTQNLVQRHGYGQDGFTSCLPKSAALLEEKPRYWRPKMLPGFRSQLDMILSMFNSAYEDPCFEFYDGGPALSEMADEEELGGLDDALSEWIKNNETQARKKRRC